MTYLCFCYILLNKIGWSTLKCVHQGVAAIGTLVFWCPGHSIAVIHSLSHVGCNLGHLNLLDSTCWSVGSGTEQPCRAPVFHNLKHSKFIPHLSHPTVTGQPRLLLIFFRMKGAPSWDSGWLKSPCPLVSLRCLWWGWGLDMWAGLWIFSPEWFAPLPPIVYNQS